MRVISNFWTPFCSCCFFDISDMMLMPQNAWGCDIFLYLQGCRSRRNWGISRFWGENHVLRPCPKGLITYRWSGMRVWSRMLLQSAGLITYSFYRSYAISRLKLNICSLKQNKLHQNRSIRSQDISKNVKYDHAFVKKVQFCSTTGFSFDTTGVFFLKMVPYTLHNYGRRYENPLKITEKVWNPHISAKRVWIPLTFWRSASLWLF